MKRHEKPQNNHLELQLQYGKFNCKLSLNQKVFLLPLFGENVITFVKQSINELLSNLPF